MSLMLFCAALPLVLVIIRKYREYSWGWYHDEQTYQNKVVIVTGASSGIGKETVKELARKKARVIMACRDLVKAKGVIKEIRSYIKTGELIPMELDLTSLKSVRQFAAEVLKDFPEIHILINNAGVCVPQVTRTEEGFEMNFITNHLGHFLLTKLLLDRLVKSGPSRVVIVSSTLHERGVLDFDNLQAEKGHFTNPSRHRSGGYNNSKLANTYFCRELAERTHGEDLEVVSCCPGFCYTDIFRYSDVKWFHYIMFAPLAYFFMRSSRQGAQTVVYCALSDEVRGHSGQMFRDCKVYNSKHKFEDSVQKKLWEVSEKLVKSDSEKLIN